MGRKAIDTRKFNKVGTRKMFGRVLIAFLLVVTVSIVLFGRIVYLGNAKGTEAQKKVLAHQSYRSNEIKYKRGDITDRNGNKMAVSRKVYDLAIDPMLMSMKQEYVKATSVALKKVFGISEKKLKKILKKKCRIAILCNEEL